MPNNNQPLQSIANAYRAKMFRAINGRKYHVKLAGVFFKQKPPDMDKYQLHNDVGIKFNDIANYNRDKSIEFGNKVKENQDLKNQINSQTSD